MRLRLSKRIDRRPGFYHAAIGRSFRPRAVTIPFGFSRVERSCDVGGVRACLLLVDFPQAQDAGEQVRAEVVDRAGERQDGFEASLFDAAAGLFGILFAAYLADHRPIKCAKVFYRIGELALTVTKWPAQRRSMIRLSLGSRLKAPLRHPASIGLWPG